MVTPPVLYIVVPCYNEEQVLPVTNALFLDKVRQLAGQGDIDSKSRILLVDDGSSDGTWDVISDLAATHLEFEGLSLSRNRGHQNALFAGLMEARRRCDVSISIDCDGQDDIDAMDAMLAEYRNGCDVVYGVRASRDSDTVFKRTSAQWFYRLMSRLGVESVYNHADYRLMSAQVLDNLADFGEVNLFLRGMVPLVGFKSTSVYYDRAERVAGTSHYPLSKMVALAANGITSLSVKPIRIITAFGFVVSLISLLGIIWVFCVAMFGRTVSGWASMLAVTCFLGGVIMLSLGVIGEYVGKIYLEVKQRPRFIVQHSTLPGAPVRDHGSLHADRHGGGFFSDPAERQKEG